MGLDESLESRDAAEAYTAGEPTPNGKRKRKTTSQVWSHFELLTLAEDGKNRCKCVKWSRLLMW